MLRVDLCQGSEVPGIFLEVELFFCKSKIKNLSDNVSLSEKKPLSIMNIAALLAELIFHHVLCIN